MRKKKYVLATVVILCVSLGTAGCMKPSKEDVVESEYYQELKEKNEKLSNQLKSEQKKTDSLNKKIKAIHETSGDQKLADYKKQVKDSNIAKVNFVSKAVKGQSFAVTNVPVCDYVKGIVSGCYRMIGITPSDLEKKYDEVYTYALIDEDNTAYEFKVYGNSYIVFDDIPANVYAYNDASVVGEGLIDAKLQKKYENFAQRAADAQIIVTDQKMKFNDTAIQASKILLKTVNEKIENASYNVEKWNEYRFYTYGVVTKVLIGDESVICIEDRNGQQTFYKISSKNLKSLKKLLK